MLEWALVSFGKPARGQSSQDGAKQSINKRRDEPPIRSRNCCNFKVPTLLITAELVVIKARGSGRSRFQRVFVEKTKLKWLHSATYCGWKGPGQVIGETCPQTCQPRDKDASKISSTSSVKSELG